MRGYQLLEPLLQLTELAAIIPALVLCPLEFEIALLRLSLQMFQLPPYGEVEQLLAGAVGFLVGFGRRDKQRFADCGVEDVSAVFV